MLAEATVVQVATAQKMKKQFKHAFLRSLCRDYQVSSYGNGDELALRLAMTLNEDQLRRLRVR